MFICFAVFFCAGSNWFMALFVFVHGLLVVTFVVTVQCVSRWSQFRYGLVVVLIVLNVSIKVVVCLLFLHFQKFVHAFYCFHNVDCVLICFNNVQGRVCNVCHGLRCVFVTFWLFLWFRNWFIGFECFALFPTRFYVLLFLLHVFVLVYNFYIL